MKKIVSSIAIALSTVSGADMCEGGVTYLLKIINESMPRIQHAKYLDPYSIKELNVNTGDAISFSGSNIKFTISISKDYYAYGEVTADNKMFIQGLKSQLQQLRLIEKVRQKATKACDSHKTQTKYIENIFSCRVDTDFVKSVNKFEAFIKEVEARNPKTYETSEEREKKRKKEKAINMEAFKKELNSK